MFPAEKFDFDVVVPPAGSAALCRQRVGLSHPSRPGAGCRFSARVDLSDFVAAAGMLISTQQFNSRLSRLQFAALGESRK